MTTRSVRLDDEAEQALSEIKNALGLSISDAIKKSLLAYRDVAQETPVGPAAFFADYDFGPGGYGIGPAAEASKSVKRKLVARHTRHDPD